MSFIDGLLRARDDEQWIAINFGAPKMVSRMEATLEPDAGTGLRSVADPDNMKAYCSPSADGAFAELDTVVAASTTSFVAAASNFSLRSRPT